MQRNAPVVFQQDNARPHVTRITQARLAAANVNAMHWPAYSPDMNPVEHIFDELGRRDRRRHAPRTVNERANALVREWNNSLICFVNSMRRRIEALIRARGGQRWY
jgi:transposase